MFKAVIVVISILMLVALIETRPRHRHRSWHKYLSYSEESAEGDDIKSCTNCNYINIGNGYKNHNIIYYGSKSKSKTQNTESEGKHHHRHRHRHRYDSDESEENQSNTNSCKNCQITNIGNGEHNYNIIYYR